ncbi:MAG TPA: prolyl oligopeptidase family serine peptidase, partial [Candidatus Angelobacter sp.]|nr:prolyl oligopeptidase family serine peptidase [Candidatus Angelobacter sp.]
DDALNEKISPLFHAKNIRAPLLIGHGANDPRVKLSESEKIVAELRTRGRPVTFVVYPDEGHGFARPVNNMALYMSAEKFLARHLGGRYQEGGTPEAVARLKEITVDPKTGVLAKKVDADAVGLPKAAVDLQPGTLKYKATIEAGGQSVPLNVSTTIAEEGGGWTATDVIDTPNGQVTQVTSLEKGTLITRKLGMKQGPVSIDLSFAGDKATGSMNMNGQDRAISVEMGGPLFAEGAGAKQSIACLPLVEGYTTTYRNFDLQQQKVKLMQLKVTGVEKVTVPAGTFDAYKLEITSADGGPDKQTLWVARDSRKPVKQSAVLASMGGAVMTQELLQ